MIGEFKKLSLTGDMVGGLRHIAEELERGTYPDGRFVVTILMRADGTLELWSHGACSTLEITGACTRAMNLSLVPSR